MCTDDIGRKSQQAWNNWLTERDQAPNEQISQWLKEQTQGGLQVVTEYARAGLERAASFHQATQYARVGFEKVQTETLAQLQKAVSFQQCGDFDELLAKRGQRSTGTSKVETRIQELLLELFRLHDLKSNGVLEEAELVKLNQKVSLLHYGKEGTDKGAIREKYQAIFRENLDPHGHPVPFEVFQDYMQRFVSTIDPSPQAQEMMLEQFVAEAQSGREAFRFPSLGSESDFAFLPAESLPGRASGSESQSSCPSSASSESGLNNSQLSVSLDSSPTRIVAGLRLQPSSPEEYRKQPCWKVDVSPLQRLPSATTSAPAQERTIYDLRVPAQQLPFWQHPSQHMPQHQRQQQVLGPVSNAPSAGRAVCLKRTFQQPAVLSGIVSQPVMPTLLQGQQRRFHRQEYGAKPSLVNPASTAFTKVPSLPQPSHMLHQQRFR